MLGANRGSTMFFQGFPSFFRERQIVDILRPFGFIRSLDLERDKLGEHFTGCGYCTFHDRSAKDATCRALQGFKLGNSVLIVQEVVACVALLGGVILCSRCDDKSKLS